MDVLKIKFFVFFVALSFNFSVFGGVPLLDAPSFVIEDDMMLASTGSEATIDVIQIYTTENVLIQSVNGNNQASVSVSVANYPTGIYQVKMTFTGGGSYQSSITIE